MSKKNKKDKKTKKGKYVYTMIIMPEDLDRAKRLSAEEAKNMSLEELDAYCASAIYSGTREDEPTFAAFKDEIFKRVENGEV